ncbi:MAG: Lpg1974 family pore-forming outer membrane protein [Planctomycetota bacterium]
MNLKQIAIALSGFVFAICIVAGSLTGLKAQYPEYPSNPGFVVSPPVQYDGGSPQTSMSPDHWGTPINNRGNSSYDGFGVNERSGFGYEPSQQVEAYPEATPWGGGQSGTVDSTPVSSGAPPSILDDSIPLPPSQFPPATGTGTATPDNGGGEFRGNSSTDVQSQPVSEYSDPLFDALYAPGSVAPSPPSAVPAPPSVAAPTPTPGIPGNEYFEYGPGDVEQFQHAPPTNRSPHIDARSSGMQPRNSVINEVTDWPVQGETQIENGHQYYGEQESFAPSEMYPPSDVYLPDGYSPQTPMESTYGGPQQGAQFQNQHQSVPYPVAPYDSTPHAETPRYEGHGFQQRLMNSVGGSSSAGMPHYTPHSGGPVAYPGFVPGHNPAIANDEIIQTQEQTGGASVLRGVGATNPNPELGFRQSGPANRLLSYDDGRRYDFENKKPEYPPFSEILATGVYYSTAELHYLQPHFQGNSAIATSAGVSEAFNFDNDPGWKMRVGFESQYGPGLDLSYFQFDQNSAPATFTSDGVVTASTSAWMIGPSEWSRLTAANAGETLTSQHSLEVHAFGAGFFKELKFPISSITGMFGFQYATILQQLDANVTDASGTVLDTLTSVSDMKAYGPRFSFEYHRPVGHTKMILVSNFGGSLMYGNRDQVVTNSSTGDLSRLGADEFVTMLDYGMAVQYRMNTGERRYISTKLGYSTQTWLGGGTAILPQDDFGFRGWVLAIGFNR